MSQVAERVKDLIAENLSVDKLAVTDEASFTIDLGADSLDTVELIMAFEKAFNMNPIPDDQAQSIQTVADAVKYIEVHENEAN
ncbi:MAG: Acyl carrier protein AcpP [Candidatus Ordinivivax streblomastigis]|jgi:acyl carrier protein|uniref:Acyl carrier protein n=1 Tax=Candidatus Ordinivivax streblomastigis TaxID=2540710 RepID=A0A5M8P2R0_9BACT|nr:MAG: Acyl carrier protein AcpP [Candidatus Ordinivivax streblomastigis]MDR2844013.1 acyl carrier protein [Candidatus Symbiothrix sp.]